MLIYMAEAEHAFCEIVRQATVDFDPECGNEFYFYICGASDLLAAIREEAEKRLNEKDGGPEPVGKYL